MDCDQTVGILKATSLFATLSGDELLILAGFITERRYASGESIFWEGDSPDWLYIVGEGRVKVAKYTSSGKELIVAIFNPPSAFGEVAVFDGVSYPASAIALDDTLVLGIKRDDLLKFLGENPSVALKIINLLGSRLREAHNRLRDMAGERVDQRIASMLVMLASRLGPTVPFTRQEIADMTGTTTETVIRTTTRLKDQGIINTTRGEIAILDPDRLLKISQGHNLD